MELNDENLLEVPALEGVYQLRDENKAVIVIKGTQNIQADLQEKLNSGTKAKYFWFETDPMYTKRESELIQQFLQQYGKMPEGDVQVLFIGDQASLHELGPRARAAVEAVVHLEDA